MRRTRYRACERGTHECHQERLLLRRAERDVQLCATVKRAEDLPLRMRGVSNMIAVSAATQAHAEACPGRTRHQLRVSACGLSQGCNTRTVRPMSMTDCRNVRVHHACGSCAARCW